MPRLFTQEPFEAAAARAEREAKWLLIDFTASWCGPCQNMERTTWRAPEVEAWVSAKAVAVQVDVDAQQDIAQRFGVQAMPTMVVVKEGKELDRAVGAQSAKQLLGWLEGLEQGKTLLDAQRAAATAGGPMERMRLAQELQARGKLEEAAEHALWVWEHALEHEPMLVGVRYSFLVELLKDLVFQAPALQARLIALRDAAEDQNTDDFLALNKVLGAAERTLAWFERVKGKEKDLAQRGALVELLVERERWADLGQIFGDPVEELNKGLALHAQIRTSVPEAMREGFEQYSAQARVELAAVLYRAMVAANRKEDAARLATRAVEADASDEMKRAVGR